MGRAEPDGAATASREHRTVRALLDLAAPLAAARSIEEVTERVTDAVSRVTECDVSGVWLIDPAHSHYELQVASDRPPAGGPRRLPVFDPDGPAGLAADPSPFVVCVGGEPRIDEVLIGWGVRECFVAPIVHRGALLGLLAAASQTPIPVADQQLHLDAVSALAHHAGTAIGNMILVAQISHQATHDALTGLPNRPEIEQRAAEALSVAASSGTMAAVAFVDLDRFKVVNDTLGHVAGDALITLVAARLSGHLRPSDVVARLGGDEFLVLLPHLDDVAQAEEVVGRLLEGLRDPFLIGGQPLFVSASAGIACYPEHGEDYGLLLARADAAMYVAKAAGRNRVAVHRPPDPSRRSQLWWESELRDAIVNDELRIVFQPQVDLITDDIVAAEALVRWQHPELGLIEPAAFIGMAEETGLIVEVDRWVRRAALGAASAWHRRGTPVRMAVNISRRDLVDTCLAADLDALLVELDLPADLVELEITDRIVMSDEELPPSLGSLRELGVRLAVDDFGTGSSVLSRLHRCPFDVLKVDRSFVQPLSHPRPDTRLVDGLISMAHALGMEVVVEGIEDEHQAHAVRLLGADLGQGFHLHRPMPAEELGQLLELHAFSPALAPVRGAGRRSLRRVRR